MASSTIKINNPFGNFNVRGYYYGAGGTVEVPIILPSYNNTILIIAGSHMESFTIHPNGKVVSPTESEITVTYSDGKLQITNGSWYTGCLILTSWKAW